MSKTRDLRPNQDYDNVRVQAQGLPAAQILVDFGKTQDPRAFAEDQYKNWLTSQGVPTQHVHFVRVDTYGAVGGEYGAPNPEVF